MKEELWRSGPVCFVAFGISLWFSILTQFVLIFLSLSRLMLVIHPIDTKFKGTNFVMQSAFLMYILSLCTALFVNVIFKFIYKNLTISLCLSFMDPTNSIIIIKNKHGLLS